MLDLYAPNRSGPKSFQLDWASLDRGLALHGLGRAGPSVGKTIHCSPGDQAGAGLLSSADGERGDPPAPSIPGARP